MPMHLVELLAPLLLLGFLIVVVMILVWLFKQVMSRTTGQQARVDESLDRSEQHQARLEAILAEDEERLARSEALISRWEALTGRIEKLLDTLEPRNRE